MKKLALSIFLFSIAAFSYAAKINPTTSHWFKSSKTKALIFNHNRSFFKSGASHWLRVSTFNLSPDSKDTFYFSKYSYYPNDSLKTITIRSHQSNKTFKDSELISYFYDAKGRKDVTLYQQIDSKSNLINLYKDSTYTDTHNNLAFLGQYSWNGNSWQLKYGEKTIYVYNAKGNPTQQIRQRADTTGNFFNDFRDDIFWNAAGTLIDSIIEYAPDTVKTWKLQDRGINIVLYHNDINKPISAIIQVDTSGTWQDAFRITETYNASGYPLTMAFDNYVKNTWVPVQLELYKYNAHNDKYLYTSNYYDDSLKKYTVIDGQADSLIYDANGHLVTDQPYGFISDTLWYPERKLIHLYKDFSGVNLAIKEVNVSVFPNPFMETLKIKFIGSSSSSVSVGIYDMTGKTMLEVQEKGSETITIPTSSIPKGIYNLLITSGKLVSSRLIVKE
jgi:hypothetical protein